MGEGEREREKEERVLARTRQSQRKSRDSRPSEYIRRRTVGESVGLGLKCGKLGVSVYVCASERGRERREAIRWYSLFLCIHLSQARADIFSSPDRFDQHSTLSPPPPSSVDPRRFAHLFTVNDCFAAFSTSLSSFPFRISRISRREAIGRKGTNHPCIVV